MDDVTFARARDGGLLMWIGPTTEYVGADDDYYGGYEKRLPPTYTFSRAQANEIVATVLRGPVGPQGPMGAQGISA